MSDSITLLNDSGDPLNARVDLEQGAITLHSRSGKDRNRDYREALEAILDRIDQAALPYQIYLDSQPVQDIPMEQRRLTFSRQAPVSERFNEIVRAMNAGTSSHGAWRRIRIEAPQASKIDLVGILSKSAASTSGGIKRLPAAELRKVTASQIDHAVARMLAGEDVPNFGPSTDYDLLAPDGSLLAPKKVFGLALEEALGIDARPAHFTAGWGNPAFEMLEAAGYPIIAKGDAPKAPLAAPADDDLALAEGSPKLKLHLKRERKPALSAAKRRAMRTALGHLECERCGLNATSLGEHGEAVIEVHHSEVTIADMDPGHVTRLSDLQCLCANCHRIVHRELAALS